MNVLYVDGSKLSCKQVLVGVLQDPTVGSMLINVFIKKVYPGLENRIIKFAKEKLQTL